MGLGSDMKLNLIELEDRIGGYVLCASEDLALPRCREVRAL